MLDNLFTSAYNTTLTTEVNPLNLICSLGISFLLGLALAHVYKYQTLYTKEFVMTLSLLPSLITMIIFLVNGNLGTGVAVAGTFSLVRFRSAAGGSRELLSIFMAMVMGIALGMGYFILAVCFSISFLLIWFSYEKFGHASHQSSNRILKVEMANDNHNINQLQKQLEQLCLRNNLITVKSQKDGQFLVLNYEVSLKKETSDLYLTRQLLQVIPNSNLSISKKVKKKKTL